MADLIEQYRMDSRMDVTYVEYAVRTDEPADIRGGDEPDKPDKPYVLGFSSSLFLYFAYFIVFIIYKVFLYHTLKRWDIKSN